MLDSLVSDINFVSRPLLPLLPCFEIGFLMLKELDKNGDEMLSARMYLVEQGTLL